MNLNKLRKLWPDIEWSADSKAVTGALNGYQISFLKEEWPIKGFVKQQIQHHVETLRAKSASDK